MWHVKWECEERARRWGVVVRGRGVMQREACIRVQRKKGWLCARMWGKDGEEMRLKKHAGPEWRGPRMSV